MSNVSVIVILILFTIIIIMSAFDCFASADDAIIAEFDSDITRLGDRQHEIEVNISQIRVEMTLLQARIDEYDHMISWVKWAVGIAAALGSAIGVVIYEQRKHRRA